MDSFPKGYYIKFLTLHSRGPLSHYKYPKDIPLGWKTPKEKHLQICWRGWHFTAYEDLWRWGHYKRKYFLVKPLGKRGRDWWYSRQGYPKGIAKQLIFTGPLRKRFLVQDAIKLLSTRRRPKWT
jgi:hypothetical protein